MMVSALELHIFPFGKTPLFSGPSSVVLPSALQKRHCSKLSFSPMEVESLEFALAMELLTSYDHSLLRM